MQINSFDELGNALSFLQCVLVARRSKINPEHITWAQYDVLELLRIRGPLVPSVISDALGSSRSSTSKILRMLKDKQLIQQTEGQQDRREQTTAITNKGQEFLAGASQSRNEAAEIAASILTKGEQAIFAELCHKVAAALQDK
ncbi:MarR family winged helix-turn-helix transcriptional regulator [Paenibacillus sp. BJ-4]|uniref:MarR family winged helix-turn-helix transcriptional regulator n=1 Tax=Paenibacillus sp. BJ-4 TaxID=2878097 RepID=UPI001CF055F6|nr:MarR family transcriptional regulator [Paenibacillus sp. BJ-4]